MSYDAAYLAASMIEHNCPHISATPVKGYGKYNYIHLRDMRSLMTVTYCATVDFALYTANHPDFFYRLAK